jgi:hypothetical protein
VLDFVGLTVLCAVCCGVDYCLLFMLDVVGLTIFVLDVMRLTTVCAGSRGTDYCLCWMLWD